MRTVGLGPWSRCKAQGALAWLALAALAATGDGQQQFDVCPKSERQLVPFLPSTASLLARCDAPTRFRNSACHAWVGHTASAAAAVIGCPRSARGCALGGHGMYDKFGCGCASLQLLLSQLPIAPLALCAYSCGRLRHSGAGSSRSNAHMVGSSRELAALDLGLSPPTSAGAKARLMASVPS